MTNHSSPVGQQCRLHAVKLTQQLLLFNIQKLEPRVIIRYTLILLVAKYVRKKLTKEK